MSAEGAWNCPWSPGREGDLGGANYSKFLADLRFAQGIVDRRVCKWSDGNGLLDHCVRVRARQSNRVDQPRDAEFRAESGERSPNSVAPGALAAKVDSDFAGVPYERSGEGAHGEDGADLLNGSWTSFAQCWRRCQAAMACLKEPTSRPPWSQRR